ncbi:hypothetical protein MIZ03_4073 [Rhodoferax lithotrophicus]|uniref:Uncharacterized protein n=1 Tax=Rhodoferax lithotrophicus TaxID=2798804 RepID=A0ABM7MSC7_9BURK|nr:hypothetical protein MIZ03_4073 [Rhodoferax sp. MIZ03]
MRIQLDLEALFFAFLAGFWLLQKPWGCVEHGLVYTCAACVYPRDALYPASCAWLV